MTNQTDTLPCLMMRWSSILPVAWATAHRDSQGEVYTMTGPQGCEQCSSHPAQSTAGTLPFLPHLCHSSAAAFLFPIKAMKPLLLDLMMCKTTVYGILQGTHAVISLYWDLWLQL